MKKLRTASYLLGVAGLAFAPLARAYAPQERHDGQRGGDERGGRDEYRFRQDDAAKLRQHYNRIEHVDIRHRPEYVAGGRMPGDWHWRIHPVPEAVIRELAPPPPGYAFGYLDGYCAVYNPTTLLIADVIDLTASSH